MGQVRYIPWTVEALAKGAVFTVGKWRTKKEGVVPADGKPTIENLKKWVDRLNESFLPGRGNEHIKNVKVYGAIVRHNGEVVSTYVEPEDEFVIARRPR